MDRRAGLRFRGRADSMRIGIDAVPLLGRGGITNYVRPLVERLCRLDTADHVLVLRRRSHSHESREAAELGELAPVRRCPLPDRLCELWWDTLERPLPAPVDPWDDLDAYLAATPFVPRLRRGRVAVVVYDLTPLRLPDLFPEHEDFRRRIATAVERSHRVVAISRRTALDVETTLGVDPGRIEVILPGVDARFRPLARAQRAPTLERLGVTSPFLLYVGSLGPHKNVGALVQAFATLARTHAGLRLVLAGSRRWGAETVAAVEASPVRDRILLPGAVDDEELPALYSAATAFAFPSRYEGFGLPVLEAMACGTPVVTSDRGALPEVVGDAAPTVDPDDPEALARELDLLVRDADLRHRRATAALERARAFDWDRSAGRLGDLLLDTAGSTREDRS